MCTDCKQLIYKLKPHNTHNLDYFFFVDDLEPLTEDLDFDAQVRCSSSIHIRIFRTAMLGANQ